MTLDGHSRAIVLGAAVSALAAFAIAMAYGESWLLVACVSAPIAWLCLELLRPRTLESVRHAWNVRVGLGVTCVLGAAALIYFGVLIVMFGDDDDAKWFGVPIVALFVAVAVALGARARTWLPLSAGALVLALTIAGVIVLGVWTAACPDCYPDDYRYSDPPSREFTFFWSFLALNILSTAYLCTLVLFTHAVRFAFPSLRSVHQQNVSA